MNESWVIEWAETLQECERLYQCYLMIVGPEFFNEESTTDKAVLWLIRNDFLDLMVDLWRDLLWHNMHNRWKNILTTQEV